jgi:CheY-like chemotaxis protein
VSANAAPAVAGRRILVVEDDVLIAMLIEDLLREHGAMVVGPVDDLDEALRLAALGGHDAAVLDVNLGGRPSAPLAARLRAAGTPFLFVTGYGRAGLPDGFADAPVLGKPFRDGDLLGLLGDLLAR